MKTQQTPTSYEDVWRQYDSTERRLTAGLSERMLDLGRVRPGMHILDMATGRGEPAVPAALRVGPAGSVLGIDADASMLKLALERVELERITNLELSVANAEVLEGVPHSAFDVVLSRWGLMYFDSPVTALIAARCVLKPDGLLVAAVWADPEQASFAGLARDVLSRLASIPPVSHDKPGTFYYADAHRLEHDLGLAGFEIQSSECVDVDVIEVSSAPELVSWVRSFGMHRLLDDVSASVQKEWEKQFAARAEHYRNDDGLIRLGGQSRIVVASKL